MAGAFLGGGEKSSFPRPVGLFLFPAYSTVLTTNMHNVKIKILQITVLSKYVLNATRKIRILYTQYDRFPSPLNWHFGLCSL